MPIFQSLVFPHVAHNTSFLLYKWMSESIVFYLELSSTFYLFYNKNACLNLLKAKFICYLMLFNRKLTAWGSPEIALAFFTVYNYICKANSCNNWISCMFFIMKPVSLCRHHHVWESFKLKYKSVWWASLEDRLSWVLERWFKMCLTN